MRIRASFVALLSCALVGTAPALADPGPDLRPNALPHERPVEPLHSSDGQPGAIAPEVPPSLRQLDSTSNRSSWQVAPGVRFTQWDEHDERGTVRAHLLRVDTTRATIGLDYANPGKVAETARVLDMVRRDQAVAGVNGDFFDITDTGAPLGVGRARGGRLLHAPRSGWNASFYVTPAGHPEIGPLPLQASIRQRPGIELTNVNSPTVAPGGIGVYTHAWGRTSGDRVTGGQRSRVRTVLVRQGRVVKSSKELSEDERIRGVVLVGRGRGARQLSRLHRGDRTTVTWQSEAPADVAISGNRFLVLDGVVQVVDDREMHPRTAVGIDRDTGELLLLVVDGRQSTSRGWTMVELADAMIGLGADEALNLDGGGSSTLVARTQTGDLEVLNSPSDGSERRVANALEVSYRPR